MCCGILSTVSCSHNTVSDESIKTYRLEDAKKGDIQDVFSDVELTELQFEGEVYPRSIRTLLIESDKIFIFDGKVVYVYSSDGKLISSSLSKKGNGPGEFTNPMGFSWNPYSEQVEILTPNKVMFYDVNFNFVRSSNLETKRKSPENPKPFMFNGIFDLSDRLHVLNLTSHSESPYRFIIYDSILDKIMGEVSYSDDVITAFNQQPVNFFRLPNGKIMCHPNCVTPYTYEFDPATYSLSKEMMVDAGSRELTKEDVDNHSENVLRYVQSCDKYVHLRTLVSSDRLVVRFKQSDYNTKDFFAFFGNDYPNGLKIDWCNSDEEQVFPSLFLIDEDYAYGLNISYYIKENPAIVLGQSEKMEQLRSIDDESWVLLKYKFKD